MRSSEGVSFGLRPETAWGLMMIEETPALWPTFIDLCCGAGGFSLGFKTRHWRPRLGVDSCAYSLETWQRNIKAPTLLADVTSSQQMFNVLDEWKGSVDAVLAGPPCQGFSMAGKRDPQDPRNTVLGYCARTAVRLSPRVIVLENVRMLAGPTFGHYLDSSLATLRRAGYAADYRVLNSVNFRVAQRRERV